MKISIFGSSHPSEGDSLYTSAYKLGQELARAGHIILSGGYIGIMEAVSRGAHDANGYTIGITCGEIENWRMVKPNVWLDEIRRYDTLVERINELVTACDAILALPGGPGTLAEIALSWNMMIINAIPIKPLILIGVEWKLFMVNYITAFKMYIPHEQSKLLNYASNTQDVMKLINNIRQ